MQGSLKELFERERKIAFAELKSLERACNSLQTRRDEAAMLYDREVESLQQLDLQITLVEKNLQTFARRATVIDRNRTHLLDQFRAKWDSVFRGYYTPTAAELQSLKAVAGFDKPSVPLSPKRKRSAVERNNTTESTPPKEPPSRLTIPTSSTTTTVASTPTTATAPIISPSTPTATIPSASLASSSSSVTKTSFAPTSTSLPINAHRPGHHPTSSLGSLPELQQRRGDKPGLAGSVRSPSSSLHNSLHSAAFPAAVPSPSPSPSPSVGTPSTTPAPPTPGPPPPNSSLRRAPRGKTPFAA